MFAEELGGNASRKRAEAAKLRRKKFKESQKRTVVDPSVSNTAVDSSETVISNNIPESVPSKPIHNPTQAKPKLAAVERAKEQREIRALLATQNNAATSIQALFRGRHSRVQQKQNVHSQLVSKLNDMRTVKDLLRAQGKEFIPPPATASGVLLLFLHTDKPTPQVIVDSLQLCLLPGLSSTLKNPIAEWPQYRIRKLTHVYLDWATASIMDTKQPTENVADLMAPLYQCPHVKMHMDLLPRLGKAFLHHTPPQKSSSRHCATALVRLACIQEGENAELVCRNLLSAPLLTWRVEPDVWMGGVVQRLLCEFHVEWMNDDEHELELCGATRSQRLLANLQCVGRALVSLQALPVYWNVVSALVQVVPPATFSTTSTAVAWINGEKPVVLNASIVDHCHWLLVDSHVRKSIACVTTPPPLAAPTAADRKMEANVQTITASQLAKDEANKGDRSVLWNSSKWARTLVDKLRSLPKESTITPPSNVEKETGGKAPPLETINSKEKFVAVVSTYAILVARWGGDAVDVVKKEKRQLQDPRVKSLLNVLGFSTNFLPVAWSFLQTFTLEKSKPLASCTADDPDLALLYLFLCTFSHVLIVTDDTELHELQKPIPVHHIRRCILLLKKILYQAICTNVDNVPAPHAKNYFGLALVTASARTMRDLYDRSSRRPICAPNAWVHDDLLQTELARCKTHEDFQLLLSESAVLRVCPFLVPFKRRLKLFERIVTTSRVKIQGENSANPFHNNPLKPGVRVRITRGRLLEDGLRTMNRNFNMRERISVQYFNEAGTAETGIDAGGLFKEFWTDLCAIAFDPNYALFRETESSVRFGTSLYPSPASIIAHGDEHITLFSFIGRILGKALFEGITIHPVFSHFTLSFLRGDYNFLHMLADLSTIDPQLYNNLMFLKTYEGDAEDLALTFTVTSDDFGGTRQIPLMANGANVDVTNANKHLYIGMVAKYYVYDRIREQSEAMMRGLFEVIDRSWLRLFNEPELQVLISGATDGKLDVDDLRANTHYVGGYTSLDPNIRRFWNVLSSLNQKQQAALLRFVTSCERPPPLGFKSLNPPFTIQRVGLFRDGERLPTASTCFNVLKLPFYNNERVLRERLIYAIEAGAGFELS